MAGQCQLNDGPQVPSEAKHTRMHGAKHAGNEFVDSVALGDKGHKGGYSALVITHVAEVGEDQLLELVDLVLEGHEVGDGLVALVRIVDRLETDVLLILEGAVELWMLLVKRELGKQVVDVFLDQGAVSAHALASHSAIQTVNPRPIRHCLP